MDTNTTNTINIGGTTERSNISFYINSAQNNDVINTDEVQEKQAITDKQDKPADKKDVPTKPDNERQTQDLYSPVAICSFVYKK